MNSNVWITKNEKGLLEAENSKGKIVATGGSLETLEDSLDLIYQYHWCGFVGILSLP